MCLLLLVTLCLLVGTVLFNDLGRYFYIFTDHWRENPWLALMESLGFTEPHLKTTGLIRDHGFNRSRDSTTAFIPTLAVVCIT